MLDFNGKRVLVLGLGDTGLSMTRWLVRHGARVHAADSRADPPHVRTLLAELPDVPMTTGPFRDADFARADVIAISPGIDRREPTVAAAVRRGVPIVGDVEIFANAIGDVATS